MILLLGLLVVCDVLGKEVIRLREEKYQLQLEDAGKETLLCSEDGKAGGNVVL